MPSLKDIRRRINSVRNTQKITKAMKLVSAAKFARANTAVVNARPYGKAFDDMVARLVAAAGDDVATPLLQVRPEQKILLAVLATDGGFCGGLNANLFKATLQFVAGKRDAKLDMTVMPLGRRAKLFANRSKYQQTGAREKALDKPNYDKAKALAAELVDSFVNKGYDHVYVAYVEFRSAMTQKAQVLQLLPIQPAKAEGGDVAVDRTMLIEPDVQTMLPKLLERQVASRIFRCMLEGAASEHGARMTAMDSATNNATKVLRRMKIAYNRARQAAITKELIEITSGANAL